jgi:urease accessory protein
MTSDPLTADLSPRFERGSGAAEIVYRRSGRGSALAHLYQRAPCRVLFPTPGPGDHPLAVLVTTSGGLAGGDRLRFTARIETGAAAVVTSQAAEKVYRSLGPECRCDVDIEVGDDAWLEWLPQETILFEGARLLRRTRAAVAPRGRLLACETVVFGRGARGERFASGLYHDGWRLSRDGRLIWADALRLEGDCLAQLDSPMAFAGAAALATVLYLAPDAAELLPSAQRLTEAARSRAGVTLVNGLLLARFMGKVPSLVRADLVHYVAQLRHAAAGLPPVAPRLWSC